jgi:hypothetical protein
MIDKEDTMEDPPGVVVPAVVHAQFMADVGRVSAIGVTVHLELGTTLPDGRTQPRAHVMMSREFAQSLVDTLNRALANLRE